jgi:hypothetical protein
MIGSGRVTVIRTGLVSSLLEGLLHYIYARPKGFAIPLNPSYLFILFLQLCRVVFLLIIIFSFCFGLATVGLVFCLVFFAAYSCHDKHLEAIPLNARIEHV